MITEAEARAVLERYDAENNAANSALDGDRLAGVEGGELLEASLGSYRADRARPDRETYKPFTHLDPQFWIPRASGHPRTFVAVAATAADSEDRAVVHFVQETPGAPWKAVFTAYARVGDPPATASASPERQARPKLDDVARDATGSARTTTAGDAAAVCGRYAAVMSVPGAPKAGFAPGSHTTDLRKRMEDDGHRDERMSQTTTVTARPVARQTFETVTGERLVPCVLDKTIETKVLIPDAHLTATAPKTIAFLGRTGPFTTVKEKFLAFVLIRVPAAPDAPATVLTGGLRQSHPLDATAT
ncbi:hypothetical protein B4N89_45620 [Embleya scabrispora]|uniref:DUF8094 domain-containing protein n=1 Tax=Embleya scabrispora TaxID=159449 RepID=A0A1T3NJ80_9ACTN|nr:hypothetical protein [Embleya scabrispora]OPC76760.1 hypothetical protein B4N89_45620 [Embleya scabrispora]